MKLKGERKALDRNPLKRRGYPLKTVTILLM